MLPARGLHRAKDGAHHRAADPDKGDHDDEPADADGLTDHDTAAGLGVGPRVLMFRTRVSGKLVTSAPPGRCLDIGIPGSETEKNVE